MATEGQESNARIFTILGFVFAVAALFILPIVLGPVGAILGGIGYKKGDRLGLWALILAIVATIAGLVLAFLVLNR